MTCSSDDGRWFFHTSPESDLELRNRPARPECPAVCSANLISKKFAFFIPCLRPDHSENGTELEVATCFFFLLKKIRLFYVLTLKSEWQFMSPGLRTVPTVSVPRTSECQERVLFFSGVPLQGIVFAIHTSLSQVHFYAVFLQKVGITVHSKVVCAKIGSYSF